MFYHTFRPPKTSDRRAWQTIQLLAKHGFYFQKIYENGSFEGALQAYPSSITEVPAFVERFRAQAIDSSS